MKRPVLIVLLLAMCVVTASATTFGQWRAESGDTFLYALTQNDSGNILGQWCYPKEGNCYWLIGLKLQCEQNAKYPILMNSDSGALPLHIVCFGELADGVGMYRYVFTDFDKITEAVMGNQRIGFAFPLQSDQFSVSRFDLKGAPAALRAMRTAAAGRFQPGRKSTLDEKL
jgi:hypothetical protein